MFSIDFCRRLRVISSLLLTFPEIVKSIWINVLDKFDKIGIKLIEGKDQE